MVPPCARRRRTIVRPIPSPCAFVVTKGMNGVRACAGQARPVSRTRCRHRCPDVAADGDATPAGGVSAMASTAFTQVHKTCCNSTGSPSMTHGLDDQIESGLDLSHAHVVHNKPQVSLMTACTSSVLSS